MNIQIPIDEVKITDFCRRKHIPRLALFGSALRQDFNGGSDVDLLLEFEPGHIPGLISLSGMEIELSDILGRKADLRTLEDLGLRFRDQVAASARTVYAS